MFLEEPTPNLPLLRKIIDHIKAHPEEHYQGGYVTNLIEALRYQQRIPEKVRDEKLRSEIIEKMEKNPCGTAYCVAGFAVLWTVGIKNGMPASGSCWIDEGAHALGLTEREALGLFQGDNTIKEIVKIAQSIAARAGEEL